LKTEGLALTEQEQTLLDILRKLSEQDAHSLMRFAEFLAGQETTAISPAVSVPAEDETVTPVVPEPEKIPRPDDERVVDALKRLSATYPMLDKKRLLDKASELVAQHVMFGKPAKQVIDEVETIFADAYDKFAAEAKRL